MKHDSDVDWPALRGHLALFYKSPADYWKLLAHYFESGLNKNEQCVFVTHELEKGAIKALQAAGLDIAKAVKDGQFKIYEMIETYLPHGEFGAKYMLHNVENFLNGAREQGYNGLRTAGEMSWLTGHSEALAEAMFYEYSINNMIRERQDFVGLCMYPVENTADIMKDDVHLTHTTVVR